MFRRNARLLHSASGSRCAVLPGALFSGSVLLGAVLLAAVAILTSTPAVAAGDPVIVAAGDIACDPTSSSFNGGLGTSSACRASAVGDAIAASNPVAVIGLGDMQYENGDLAKYLQSYDHSWADSSRSPIRRPAAATTGTACPALAIAPTSGQARGSTSAIRRPGLPMRSISAAGASTRSTPTAITSIVRPCKRGCVQISLQTPGTASPRSGTTPGGRAGFTATSRPYRSRSSETVSSGPSTKSSTTPVPS